MTPAAAKPVTRSTRASVLEFLGSMNLAITLLVAIGVASVIGTVLKQNEPYQNYVFKFGSFWFEVFESMGLYDVYSAAWFIAILGFLVISTSICIYRNAPVMLQEMRSYRLGARFNSLSAFHCNHEWRLDKPAEGLMKSFTRVSQLSGYQVRSKIEDSHAIVAAKKGSISRLGYIFTHSAIVIICIGALLDGNLPLKWRAFTGDITIETRDISASNVPAASRLPASNPSFRGSVSIAEGSSANLVFLNLRDGYLVQQLPFSIEVKDFRIEHYSTGQPKSFESDLLIHDEDLAEPLAATISVNHPLTYKGHTIYQASFADGGSRLELRLWPLSGADRQPNDLQSVVFEEVDIETVDGVLSMDISNFRLFNINPVQEADSDKAFRNFGPNFQFKLRNAAGDAVEYENYMSPVEMDGRNFYLSGMRAEVGDPFQYLYMPAGPNGGIERFMKFNAALSDADKVRAAAEETTRQGMAAAKLDDPKFTEEVIGSMTTLFRSFAANGFDAVAEHVASTVPADQRESVIEAYMKVLQSMLAIIYRELLVEIGVDLEQGVNQQDSQFFDDAVNAVGAIGAYRSPFYAQLASFEHIQATGLQIARAPGKNMVYFGFALLIAGVFCMFYVPVSRLWLWVDNKDGQTRVLFAGTGHRHQRDFADEFEKLRGILDREFIKSDSSL